MGKNNIKYKRSIMDKLVIKGRMADDNTIVFEDDDGNDVITPIANCFKDFIGEDITLTITCSNDEDLDIDNIVNINLGDDD